LLELYEDDRRESSSVKAIAEGHLTDIDDKIAQLKAMRATLAHLVHACAGDHRPDCPILDDLGKMGNVEPVPVEG
jgi:DNA-binding transcriptional MerR regulator